MLYATGLGLTDPAYLDGQLIGTPAVVHGQTTVQIGGLPAIVRYAGLVGPGLYQLNVDIPDVPTGDAQIILQVEGTQSSPLYVPIQK